MAVAGYNKKVFVATKPSSGDPVWKCLPTSSSNLDTTVTELDTTQTCNTHNFMTRIAGLRDWTVGVEGYLEGTPTEAYTVLQNAFDGDGVVLVKYSPNGQDDAYTVDGEGIITALNINSSADGLIVYNATINGNGALSKS